MNNIIDTTVPKAQHLSVDQAYAEQRLDNFLVSRLKGLPKSRLYRLLRKGEIRVNKKRVKPDYRIQAGDDIRIPPIRLAAQPEIGKPAQHLVARFTDSILYEDKSLLVINKPTGVAVHGGSGINFGVIETLRQLYPREKYLELVHRLDKDTSGCLLIAKKPSALKHLHELIRTSNIEKVYIALVKGDWPRSVKQVDAPLYKNQLSSGERIVKVSAQGKPSLTRFKVLQRFGNATLMEAQPVTGRTHQIRVHAAHAGHPLAMDDKYGDKAFNKWVKEQGGKRLFLHAVRLSFQLPNDSNLITVAASVPDDIAQCLKQLG